MFRRSTVALLAALITAPTALLASAPRAHATAPGLNGRVAYFVPTTDPNVKNEIVTVNNEGSGAYIADADGSNVAALSPGQFDEYPSFSPDGTTIVFDRVVGSATEIFTMKPDGTGVTQVTTHGGTNELPRFSPDGTQIVFQTSKPAPAPSTGTIYGIAVVSADGTADRDLPVSPQQQFTAPDWQPITQPIAPGSPQQVSAVAGHGSATVSWAA